MHYNFYLKHFLIRATIKKTFLTRVVQLSQNFFDLTVVIFSLDEHSDNQFE